MKREVRMFRDRVLRPALQPLGLWSDTAELLLLGTAAQESQFRHLEQIGGGPALGLYQMEPATHDDIWENWLKYRPVWNARARWWGSSASVPGSVRPQADEVTWNLRYATVMARLHYYRVKERLPASYPHTLARYWKIHYNTTHGGGLPEEFVANYERYVK